MHSTLELVLILLATAVRGGVVFRQLRLPALIGYLLVGILIGPHALGWVPDTEETRYLAEFGVVFLMFSIGLEFSLPKLRHHAAPGVRSGYRTGGRDHAAGPAAVSLLFGLDWRAGLALGGVLAMSSTAIVGKMLVERPN